MALGKGLRTFSDKTREYIVNNIMSIETDEDLEVLKQAWSVIADEEKHDEQATDGFSILDEFSDSIRDYLRSVYNVMLSDLDSIESIVAKSILRIIRISMLSYGMRCLIRLYVSNVHGTLNISHS